MRSYYQAELLKHRHTVTGKLFWTVPLLLAAFTALIQPFYFQINYLNWWYVLILPGMLLVVGCIVGQKDAKWREQVLTSSCADRRKVWRGKIIVCARTLAYACLLAAAIAVFLPKVLSLLYPQGQMVEIPPERIAAAAVILTVTWMWQIPVCLFLEEKSGMFLTVLVGISANTGFGIALSTGEWWWLLPFAIPERLMCPVVHILPNGMQALEGNPDFSPGILEAGVIVLGILISALWFLILWRLTERWYVKREAE